MSPVLIAVCETDERPFKSIRLYMASLMEIYTRCYFCHTDLTTCNNNSHNVQQTAGNNSLQRGYQIKLAEYSHSQLQIDGQPTGQRHQATYLSLSLSSPHHFTLPLLYASVGTLYGVVLIYSRARCADFSNTLLTDKRAPSLANFSCGFLPLPFPSPTRSLGLPHTCV